MGVRIKRAVVDTLARQGCDLVDPFNDLHASAAYRRHATGALIAQALDQVAGLQHNGASGAE